MSVETNNEMLIEPVKSYLEEQVFADDALAVKYDSSLIEDCVEYIIESAKEKLGGKNGYIRDDVVFKMARDYFIDDIGVKRKAEKEAKEAEEKRKAELQKIYKKNKERFTKPKTTTISASVDDVEEVGEDEAEKFEAKVAASIVPKPKSSSLQIDLFGGM